MCWAPLTVRRVKGVPPASSFSPDRVSSVCWATSTVGRLKGAARVPCPSLLQNHSLALSHRQRLNYALLTLPTHLPMGTCMHLQENDGVHGQWNKNHFRHHQTALKEATHIPLIHSSPEPQPGCSMAEELPHCHIHAVVWPAFDFICWFGWALSPGQNPRMIL